MENADDANGYVPAQLVVTLMVPTPADTVSGVSAVDGHTFTEAELAQVSPATLKRAAMALGVMLGLAGRSRTVAFMSGEDFGRLEQRAGSGNAEYR